MPVILSGSLGRAPKNYLIRWPLPFMTAAASAFSIIKKLKETMALKCQSAPRTAKKSYVMI